MGLLKLTHIPDSKFDIYLPCSEEGGGKSIGTDPFTAVLWEENREWCDLVLVAALGPLPVPGGGGAG